MLQKEYTIKKQSLVMRALLFFVQHGILHGET